MSEKRRIALIQHACGDDRVANVASSVSRLRDAARNGADLAVLHELHCGRYFPQTEDTRYFEWAEPIPGPLSNQFGQVAKELGIVIVTTLFERRTAGIYHNTAVVFERDGSIAGTYRKMHIPDDPGFYEKFYFTPGDLGIQPIQTSVGRIGVLICWDQWFPEAARLMALRGAEMLVYPTSIGWNPVDPQDENDRQRDAWVTVQRGHAVANGIPVISVNRVGHEPDPSRATAGIDFWGTSFAAGPQGEMLCCASIDREEILLAEIDLARSEAVRTIWPFLRDRRIDGYSGLESRYLD